MRVFVLAYGDGEAASTTYRFRALQRWWQDAGHELTIGSVQAGDGRTIDFLRQFDVLINQKAIISCGVARRFFGAGRPVFFDFDDAIWTRPKPPYTWWTQWRVNRRIRCWLRPARGVLVANQHLADFARRYSRDVHVLPMALDLEQWRPRSRALGDRVIIGWAGAPGNLGHLEGLGPALKRVLKARPQARLAVFCGKKPAFEFPFEYQPFAPGKEVDFVSSLDVGLLPLQLDAYSLFKSPIKALQYLSCAVPVIGEVRGATTEILNPTNSLAVETESDWERALETLIDAPGLRAALGQAGREQVERQHDLREISERLLGILG